MRWRCGLKVYAAQRVTLVEIVKVTAFTNVSFSLGMAGIAGGGLLTAPAWRLHAVHLPPEVARVVGVVLLLAIPAYVILCAAVRGVLSVLGHKFVLPTWKWAVAQVVIGVVDNVLTVLIPWVLLPTNLIGLGAFTGAFAVATVTGVVSSVPGGAGVFESVLLTLLPHVDRAPLAAAFVGYRLFYFLIPLGMAVPVKLPSWGGARRRRPRPDARFGALRQVGCTLAPRRNDHACHERLRAPRRRPGPVDRERCGGDRRQTTDLADAWSQRKSDPRGSRPLGHTRR